MIIAALTVFLIGLGAVAIGLVERALGPDHGRFPCASPLMRWTIRFYALVLFFRAALLGVDLYRFGYYGQISPDALPASLGMASTHIVLLTLLIRSRLPVGVWPRIERRWDSIRKIARTTHSPGATALAVEGVRVLPMNPSAEDLARQ